MADIFVSHSSHDLQEVDFFSRVAAGTNVRLIVEEFEKIVSGVVNAVTIQNHIRFAKAVFLLLSPNVHGLPHTRDWVLWESGVAANKDVWVFERYRDQGKVSVIVPFVRHYVVFEPSDACFRYFKQIIESYNDSHVLGTLLVTTGIGALIGRGGGAAAGVAAGLMMADRSNTRPAGLQ